ncbi:MAG TPA: hotdog fold domain-containing protein [Dehalococcoidia bacterium]|jgi:predicted thioesterase
MSAAEPASAGLTVVVEVAHTTTHLPPDRAVITTPALVALMEQCIAMAEPPPQGQDGRWLSVAADVKHRAGARRGETIEVRAERRADASVDRAVWQATAKAEGDRLIAEGTIERLWEAACRE